MKAARYYGPKDVRVKKIPIPKTPEDGVLIKIGAALTCGTDLKMYKRGHKFADEEKERLGDAFEGVSFGHECAGEIVEVGPKVKNYKVGDRVALDYPAPCGHCYYCMNGQPNLCQDLAFIDGGAFAQYIAATEYILDRTCMRIPEGMSYASAALFEPVACALHGVEAGNIQTGDYVVINGAGPIGLAMVADCYLKGAYVIVCDMNAYRLQKAKELGAHKIIDLSIGVDQVQAVLDSTPDRRGCDVVIEATGILDVWEMAPYMSRPGGTIVMFGGVAKGLKFTIDCSLLHYSELTIKGIFYATQRHMYNAFELIKRGEISEKDFVTNTYKLDDVIEAMETHSQGVKNCIICNDEYWEGE